MFYRTRRLQNFFFLKCTWRCHFLPNKRGRQRSWPCIFPPFPAQGLRVSFHIAYMEERTYVRTLYGRSDGSDVITKPKFLALMGLPKSLSYGPPLARALWRARELRYKAIHFFSSFKHLVQWCLT